MTIFLSTKTYMEVQPEFVLFGFLYNEVSCGGLVVRNAIVGGFVSGQYLAYTFLV
jgi:hypothetical protein